MIPVDALETMIKSSDYPSTKISEMIGRSKNYITSTICTARKRGGFVSTDTIAKVSNICGFSFALVRNNEVPEDAIVLTLSDD